MENLVRSGGHRVESKQAKARQAEVDTVQGVVAQPAGSERAPIADAMVQNAPGVRQIVPVFPEDAEHLEVMVGLLMPQAEGAKPGDPHSPFILHLRIRRYGSITVRYGNAPAEARSQSSASRAQDSAARASGRVVSGCRNRRVGWGTGGVLQAAAESSRQHGNGVRADSASRSHPREHFGLPPVSRQRDARA